MLTFPPHGAATVPPIGNAPPCIAGRCTRQAIPPSAPEELRALGVKNPYKDLSESYWAYGELIEATVKHNAADWHKLNYNEENLNTVVERFVDSEGSQIAEPITTKCQTARATRDFKNRNYLGYTTEITYVYRQGQAVMTGSKEVDKREAKVGDTLHYTVTVGNDKSAAGTLRNAVVSDTLSQHYLFYRCAHRLHRLRTLEECGSR